MTQHSRQFRGAEARDPEIPHQLRRAWKSAALVATPVPMMATRVRGIVSRRIAPSWPLMLAVSAPSTRFSGAIALPMTRRHFGHAYSHPCVAGGQILLASYGSKSLPECAPFRRSQCREVLSIPDRNHDRYRIAGREGFLQGLVKAAIQFAFRI